MPARIAHELRRIADRRNPLWALPLTATPEEQLLATIAHDFRLRASGTIAIRGPRSAVVSALADLCRRAGFVADLWPPVVGALAARPDAVLWDTTAPELHEPARVVQLRAGAGDAPIIALMGFPRPGDYAAARRAGLAAVVAKPFLASDLLDEIERIAGAAR